MQGAVKTASGIISGLGGGSNGSGPAGPASGLVGTLPKALPSLPSVPLPTLPLDPGGLRNGLDTGGAVDDALRGVGAALVPTLGRVLGTGTTEVPNSLGMVLAPITGSLPTITRSLPTLLQPLQNALPQTLAPIHNVLPTLPGIGKVQPPLATVTSHLPDLPKPPAPSVPGSGPGGPTGSAPTGGGPAGPTPLGPSPTPLGPPSPSETGSPVSHPGAAPAGGDSPTFPGASSFLGTPLSPAVSAPRRLAPASAAPPVEPGNGPQDSPSIPLPSVPPTVSLSGGAGGWFFVPLAALMALVGLSAPAIMRRLREAAALPAPTPFVCALERPG